MFALYAEAEASWGWMRSHRRRRARRRVHNKFDATSRPAAQHCAIYKGYITLHVLHVNGSGGDKYTSIGVLEPSGVMDW